MSGKLGEGEIRVWSNGYEYVYVCEYGYEYSSISKKGTLRLFPSLTQPVSELGVEATHRRQTGVSKTVAVWFVG